MAITITEHPSSCASSRLYLVNIHNVATVNTTVTAHPVVVHYWLRFILRHPRLIFGLGVHWTRSNANANNHPAAVLQLYVYHYCLIFQLRHAPYSPGILRWLLSHPRATFVGLYSGLDSVGLLRSHHRLWMYPGMPMDLRELAVERAGDRLRSLMIAGIAWGAIGVEMEWDWGVSKSDFGVEVLSVGQVKHAAVYGYVCYEIGVLTRAWLYNPRLQVMGVDRIVNS